MQYFSQLRELGGPLSIEVEPGATIQDLLQQLFLTCPALTDWNKHLLIAAGYEWVSREYIIRDADVISLMPPVQGG